MTSKLTKWVARPALTATTAAVICAGLLGLAAAPAAAGAATLDELTQQIEQTNESYESASQLVEEIEAKIAANEERISQIEAELPEKREAAANCMKIQYKLQQGSAGLIELLLSAENFNELVSTIQYLDIINSHNNNAIDELVALDEELSQTRLALETEKQQAEASKQEAQESLSAAVSARQALEQQMAEQAAAEEAQRQAAVAAAAAAASNATNTQDASGNTSTDTGSTDSGSQTTFDTESGNTSTVTVPEQTDPGTVDWSSDKSTFVSSWGSRIDAYLSGSPLAGYGRTFAEAAWDYGCDPRFSPAISCIESGKGTYCFKSHNAWGWGSVSWSDWETAIRAHTKGLASIYGGHLTYSGAQMYCPPNADFWYSSVAAQMELI